MLELRAADWCSLRLRAQRTDRKKVRKLPGSGAAARMPGQRVRMRSDRSKDRWSQRIRNVLPPKIDPG
jgi:hypothetical protein